MKMNYLSPRLMKQQFVSKNAFPLCKDDSFPSGHDKNVEAVDGGIRIDDKYRYIKCEQSV